ncbi:UBX domain-containing protein 4 [Dunckerocampus dactyliophorus]|uniref:UBX domain-containing protein 4 n=1 Tax=Dunckerocampus dactyliophorus TaxID=161453 RepID=UPI0024062A2B|nr:UBX domain-containing protein 4 [Dunckerocampus dactyliophorus]
MFWFNGSIPDAINLAKQRSFVFVVVIVGEDEQSANLMSSWEDVSETAHNGCVAVKVDAKSDTCVQFSQIYPVVCIPSSFFIGENGIPLEVIAGSVSATELEIRINKVKQMHAQQIGKQQQEATAPVISATQPTLAAPFVASVSTISTEEAVEGLEPGQGCEAAACSQSAAENGCPDTSLCCPDETNPDAKVERVNKPEGKQKTALEDECRAERAAIYAKFLEEKAKKVAQQAEQAEEEARKAAVVRQRSTIARLQFRLPDGSSFTNQFSSQSKLQEAYQFAVQEVGNRYGNFSMATMFPRREFTSEDFNKTLLELDLAPSSSIVLVPCGRASSVVPSSGGGIWAVLNTLFHPILSVWRFLSSWMFAPAPQETSRRSFPSSHSHTNSATRSDKTKIDPLSVPPEKQPKNFKKDGKICQLKTHEDSEDDNNTWNGNSTQQM